MRLTSAWTHRMMNLWMITIRHRHATVQNCDCDVDSAPTTVHQENDPRKRRSDRRHRRGVHRSSNEAPCSAMRLNGSSMRLTCAWTHLMITIGHRHATDCDFEPGRREEQRDPHKKKSRRKHGNVHRLTNEAALLAMRLNGSSMPLIRMTHARIVINIRMITIGHGHATVHNCDCDFHSYDSDSDVDPDPKRIHRWICFPCVLSCQNRPSMASGTTGTDGLTYGHAWPCATVHWAIESRLRTGPWEYWTNGMRRPGSLHQFSNRNYHRSTRRPGLLHQFSNRNIAKVAPILVQHPQNQYYPFVCLAKRFHRGVQATERMFNRKPSGAKLKWTRRHSVPDNQGMCIPFSSSDDTMSTHGGCWPRRSSPMVPIRVVRDVHRWRGLSTGHTPAVRCPSHFGVTRRVRWPAGAPVGATSSMRLFAAIN